jgi:pimeloyl-ACP methyl ester carboxylesterase
VALHYAEWNGPGESLLLLTGLGSSACTFDRFVQGLPELRVVSFTRRGQPPSDTPPSGYDLPTLTGDVEAVMRTLGITRPHLMAHSLGCLEMTELARQQPDSLRSLVYLDGATNPARVSDVMSRDPVQGAPPPPGSVTAQIDAWWTQHSPDYSVIHLPCLALFAVQESHPYAPRDATAEQRRLADGFWRSDAVPLIYDMADAFKRQAPAARVVVLRHASHNLHMDRETEVLRLVREFYRLS